jgi:hypothetical protein
MSAIAEQYEHAGLTVKIQWEEYVDENDNPRTNGDCQLGTMYCWHPDYVLGDEQFTHADHPDCETLVEVAEEIKRERKALCMLPLVLLDHSGISIRVGTSFGEDPGGWDTTIVGWIFTTQERIDELGCPEDKIEEGLRAEVKEYDAYLRGEVYHFTIEDEDEEVLDGCGGFVGDIDYCKEAAEEAAECCAETIVKETAEAAHWAARDVVTA